jgi:PhnB protein
MERANYQPTGMRTISPYLMVDKVLDLIEFIETVFGGTLKYKLDRPGGTIMHAEMIIGDSVIMAGEPWERFGAFPASIYIYVSDCDRIYEKAIMFGATSIMMPTTMTFSGQRYGCVKDSNGNIWWIATQLEDLTPQEQAIRIEEMKEKWAAK